jgi:hypothetical protein
VRPSWLVVLTVAACAGSRTDRTAEQPRSAPPAAQPSPPAPAAPPVSPAATAPGSTAATASQRFALRPEVRQACDGVSAFWRDSAQVREQDSTVTPFDAPSAVHACLVLVYQEHGLRRGPGVAPDTVAMRLGPARALVLGTGQGWIWLNHYAADGPDGTSMGYQRGNARCVVEQSWDGGDDSDSTYVPADWFRETTTCWSAPDLTVTDTTP